MDRRWFESWRKLPEVPSTIVVQGPLGEKQTVRIRDAMDAALLSSRWPRWRYKTKVGAEDEAVAEIY